MISMGSTSWYKREGISLEDVLKGTAGLMGIEPKLCLNKSKRTPQVTGAGVNYYTIDKNIETKAHIKRQLIFDA
jgi:hypothetical protein